MFEATDTVDPHAATEDFFSMAGRGHGIDVPCPYCDDGSLEITSAGYTCTECDSVLSDQHIDPKEETLTYERYDNSGKWRMRGAYDVHEWEGSYSFENLSEDDSILSRR